MPRKGKTDNRQFKNSNETPSAMPNVPNMLNMPNMPNMPNFPGLGNMNEIVSMAQKIAQNVTQDNQNQPIDIKNLDMSKILSQVSGEVSKIVTPDFIDQMNNKKSNFENDDRQVENSKINLGRTSSGNKIQELNDSDSEDNENISS